MPVIKLIHFIVQKKFPGTRNLQILMIIYRRAKTIK